MHLLMQSLIMLVAVCIVSRLLVCARCSCSCSRYSCSLSYPSSCSLFQLALDAFLKVSMQSSIMLHVLFIVARDIPSRQMPSQCLC
ncbi:hypothetical protein EJ03DRAFT_21938 [Teratosphaeria nubilosa]|uniref:Secreted protein n=1 Tax=Teratosphaeria nubilosa TaxID=161662 RepID=A0A6G1LGY5_9PEZI|nr:hypothetical protein EJ03DRAFT_21938 [Teratosphaeria nubilosa]